MKRRVSSWILLVVVAAGALPFARQAFHIDDRIYLETARHILQDPLSPYDYPVVFEGIVTPDAASHSHLPLTSYYLALVTGLGGEREWLCHLAFLLFPMLAVLGFADLASGYLRSPHLAALLLAFSTGFYVLSHTLMTDVALLAFWLVALARFRRLLGPGRRRPDLLWCAAALAGASFLSLTSLALLLLMGLMLALRWRELEPSRARRLLWLLALPWLIWGLWMTHGYLHYGRLLLQNTWLHMEKRQAFSLSLFSTKFLSLLVNLGGATLFPLALWAGFGRAWSTRVCLLAFFVVLAPFSLWWPQWGWGDRVLFAAFFSTGLLVLVEAARRGFQVIRSLAVSLVASGVRQLSFSRGETRPVDSQQERMAARWCDEVLLFFWFAGAALICLGAYYSGSVRYTLLLLPPLILWWVDSLERRIEEPYFLRNALSLTLVLTLLYSGPVAWGDYRFAETYRRAAPRIVKSYAAPSRTLWFTGEWGFRYYMERAGARILTRTSTSPRPGDIIVKPYLASPWVTLFDDDRHLELLEQRPAPEDFPLRLLDPSSHAGFYSTGWGILPFNFRSSGRWEWFNVFQVKLPYQGPVPKPERHY